VNSEATNITRGYGRIISTKNIHAEYTSFSANVADFTVISFQMVFAHDLNWDPFETRSLFFITSYRGRFLLFRKIYVRFYVLRAGVYRTCVPRRKEIMIEWDNYWILTIDFSWCGNRGYRRHLRTNIRNIFLETKQKCISLCDEQTLFDWNDIEFNELGRKTRNNAKRNESNFKERLIELRRSTRSASRTDTLKIARAV